MVDPSELPPHVVQLVASLNELGQGVMTGPDGQRVFIQEWKWQPDTVGILVAYEGGGCIFWGSDDGFLNEYKLTGAGFPITIAGEIAGTLNQVVGLVAAKRIEGRAE